MKLNKLLVVCLIMTFIASLFPIGATAANTGAEASKYSEPVPVHPKGPAYFISPDGDDTKNGRSRNHPWKTFAHAITQLQPGDTLVLLDGVYEKNTTGFFSAACGENAISGTTKKPITIMAENERQAWLKGDGSETPFQVLDCAYWDVIGLRVSDADMDIDRNTSNIMLFNRSHHINIKRLLLHHANRYTNSSGLQFTSSHHMLAEEVEVYYFHRHGISAYQSDNVTIRRSYVNARNYEDIPGVGGSHACCTTGGDEGYSFYFSSNSILENSVSVNSEGLSSIAGIETILGNPGGQNNQMLGVISYKDLRPSFVQSRKFAEWQNMGPFTGPGKNILIKDFLVVGGEETAPFTPRAVSDLTVDGATWINAKLSPFNIIADSTSLGREDRDNYRPDYYQGCHNFGGCDYDVRNVLFLDDAVNTSGALIQVPNHPDLNWLMEYSNAWSSAQPDRGFGLAEDVGDTIGEFQHSTEMEPTGMGLSSDRCIVYVPEDSSMKGAGKDGADIGANILYRYVDGQLTDVPLWDPATGTFPHGEVIEGINDVPGDSLFDLHEQLNVNTNGCILPYSSGDTGVETPSSYSVGFASVDITPELGITMPSQGTPTKAEGTYLPLQSRVMTVGDGEQTVVFVSSEILYWSAPNIDHLRQLALERYQLEPDQLVFNTSHTHNHPSLPADAPHTIEMIEKTVDAIGEALEGAQQAKLYFGRGEIDFTTNRRRLFSSGYSQWGINPYGSKDSEVTVLQARDLNGDHIGMLFNAAFHPTVIRIPQYGGDAVGYAMVHLAEDLGGEAVFMQGTAGEINVTKPSPSDPYFSSFGDQPEEAEAIGVELADEVKEILNDEMTEVEGNLWYKMDVAKLPLLKQELSFVGEEPFEGPQRRVARLAKLMLESMDDNGNYLKTKDSEVQVIRLGEQFIFVGLNGEVTSPIGTRTKARLIPKLTMVAGYTNKNIGYIPSMEMIQERGYETDDGPYSPEVEDFLIGKVMELVEEGRQYFRALKGGEDIPDPNVEVLVSVEANDFSRELSVDGMRTFETFDRRHLGGTRDGRWTAYEQVDFTDATDLILEQSTTVNGGSIELRLDSVEGELIGKYDVTNTEGSHEFIDKVNVPIKEVDGVHTLYLAYKATHTVAVAHIYGFELVRPLTD